MPSARKTLSLGAAAVSNQIYACKDVSLVIAWIVRVIVQSLASGLADCSMFVAPQRQTSNHRTVCWFTELDTCRCPTNAWWWWWWWNAATGSWTHQTLGRRRSPATDHIKPPTTRKRTLPPRWIQSDADYGGIPSLVKFSSRSHVK